MTYMLPKRTLSRPAHTLHALLRYSPGYQEVKKTPRQAGWVIESLSALAEEKPEVFHRFLPDGCMTAVTILAEHIPFSPLLSYELTIDTTCLLIVNLAAHFRFVREINQTLLE